uniref:Regulatory protein E2 n=1 Tax=Rhesus papillomavirus 1b TaxID=464935 RepID=C3PUK5_RHPV1|nr:E2 [Rhesus papillomavirus 1b]
MMEALAERLSALQDRILELYEDDSKDLKDQIEHWKCVRQECAVLYKAREVGFTHLNHQVVPPLTVSRAKAHKAIEVQLALESLQNSEYNDEEWTLQDASLEMWHTEPKGCFKKKGVPVTVLFDCDKDNTMEYVLWGHIYVWGDNGWVKTFGEADNWGLHYTVAGDKVYYVQFYEDAKKYGHGNGNGDGYEWEVHVGGTVMHYSDSVSSATHCDKLPTVEIVSGLQPINPSPPPANPSAKENVWSSPAKRVRRSDSGGDPVRALDGKSRSVLCGSAHNNATGSSGDSNYTPIVHLKGESNCLKCLRFRLGKHKNLYINISSTWRWANHANEKAIVTVTFASELQRQQFLSTVKIPSTVTLSQGVMTV